MPKATCTVRISWEMSESLLNSETGAEATCSTGRALRARVLRSSEHAQGLDRSVTNIVALTINNGHIAVVVRQHLKAELHRSHRKSGARSASRRHFPACGPLPLRSHLRLTFAPEPVKSLRNTCPPFMTNF